jgi:hypothetical protein
VKRQRRHPILPFRDDRLAQKNLDPRRADGDAVDCRSHRIFGRLIPMQIPGLIVPREGVVALRVDVVEVTAAGLICLGREIRPDGKGNSVLDLCRGNADDRSGLVLAP